MEKTQNADRADKTKQKTGGLAEYRGEFKKITWPTKKELTKQTITVIITCIIIAIIIFLYDFSLNWLIQQFHALFV